VLESIETSYLLVIGGKTALSSKQETLARMPTFIIIVILFIIAALASGCQNASSTAAKPDAVPPVNTARAEDPKPKDPKPAEPISSTAGSLATPTETYKTAYELRKKKDIEGLKAIMSDDIKEFLTMMGEADKKSLDDMIREMCEKPQAERAESRNEKITGDTATVEYLTEKGDWKTMDFERVDGKWLMGFPKADKADVDAQK
jgi:hypothetical protein